MRQSVKVARRGGKLIHVAQDYFYDSAGESSLPVVMEKSLGLYATF